MGDFAVGLCCYALRLVLAAACVLLIAIGVVAAFDLLVTLLLLGSLALGGYLLIEAGGLTRGLGLLLSSPVLAIRFCPYLIVAVFVVPMALAAAALFAPLLLMQYVVWRLIG
ncbi:MAG: hypothetical protein AB7K24_18230 [Gemmataceae bacterium]